MSGHSSVVMYGLAPSTVDPIGPRTFPDIVPHVAPPSNPFTLAPLTPCMRCSRHVITGTECPFCFRESDETAKLRARVAELEAANTKLLSEGRAFERRLADALSFSRDSFRHAVDTFMREYAERLGRKP